MSLEENQDLNCSHTNNDSSQVKYRAAQRSTWISVGVNLVLTIVQVIVGWWSNSQALVADGLHSLSDLIADGVVLIANKHSQALPDEDHHYGHQRYETAASMVVGMLLLALGCGMLWSAGMKLYSPGDIPAVHPIALWVALAALVLKELLFRYLLRVGEQVRSSMLIANAWHARSDAASSLVVAIGIGGNLLGFRLLDPVAALIMGGLIIKIGWKFTWDALNDLMDQAIDQQTLEAIQATIASTSGVRGHHDLRTRKMGDLIIVDVHLEVDGHLSVREGHDIALLARQRVMEQHQVLNMMTHVDPV
jgi:cation diffusion facilitator family transporter